MQSEIDKLRRAAEAERRAKERTRRIMVGLNEQGVSYRTIAGIVDRPHKTVQRAIQAERERMADHIVSVGYEGRTVNELLSDVRNAGTHVLIDVRENAISRKAGFSKRALAAACSAHGIEYRHEPTMGNPKSNRDGFREGLKPNREVYRRHLRSTGQDALARTAELLASRTVAVLCFEAAECQCHRSVVVEELRRERPALVAVSA